jgi:CCR4-NOT transcriptional regulation complex NOT5 subunit
LQETPEELNQIKTFEKEADLKDAANEVILEARKLIKNKN